jgi:hypothetical protein
MYGLALLDLVKAAEQEHARDAETAAQQAQVHQEPRRRRNHNELSSAWAALWAHPIPELTPLHRQPGAGRR